MVSISCNGSGQMPEILTEWVAMLRRHWAQYDWRLSWQRSARKVNLKTEMFYKSWPKQYVDGHQNHI
jgi:hypothetical protein